MIIGNMFILTYFISHFSLFDMGNNHQSTLWFYPFDV
jgi:hypothetical protein